MRRTTVDLSPEKKLVTHMIVSDPFINAIAPVFRSEYLQSPYARFVSDWVLEYFRHYKKAPGKTIQDLFAAKSKQITREDDSEDIIDNIAEFIRDLNERWKSLQDFNVGYAIDQAIHWLKIRSLEILSERLATAISESNPTLGEQYVSQYGRVELPSGQGFSLTKNPREIMAAFADTEESVFSLPGALGLVAGRFEPGDFFFFLGPMKRGKTWWLLFIAECALYAGCNVVFFSLEMLDKPMKKRAWRQINGQPVKSGNVDIPYFHEIEYDGKKKYTVQTKTESRDGIDLSEVDKRQKALRHRVRGGDVRYISLPSNSASIEDLEGHLDNLEHFEDFMPDVVIIDYMDLVSTSRGFRGEYRHQIDDIWKKGRAMAQRRKIVLATASQAGKGTFHRDVSEEDAAEDTRKMAHATCVLGLNQTEVEAKQGIMRVSQLLVREGRRAFEQAVVLQCLDMGRPYLDSKLKVEYIPPEDDDDVHSGSAQRNRSRRRS